MLRLGFLLAFSLLPLRLIFPSSAAIAGQQLENLAVGYSSLAGHHTPMWIAVEDRIGRKYGIELKAIYAGRLRPQQLLMSGDVPIVVATGQRRAHFSRPRLQGSGHRRDQYDQSGRRNFC